MRNWFTHPELLFILILLPLLGILASWDARRRRRVLASVGGAPVLMIARIGWRLLRGLCLLLGLVTLGIAVAGPQWGRDFSQSSAPGRDLVVVLDCSKSMLAETPSRLERAQAALINLADTLRQTGGHRIALVTFAGRAKLVCPLTHDCDYFRSVVKDLDPMTFDADLGPIDDSSGTRIGLGLCEAVRAHDDRFADIADILLLSDGDDPAHDDEWQIGIEEARQRRIPVYVVGFGDPETASVIHLLEGGGLLQFEGKDARTKLEETPLREIANDTGGTYFPARMQPVALGSLYLDAIATRPQRDDGDDSLPIYRSQSGWFYGPAFALLACSMLFGGTPVLQTRREP